MRIVIDWVLPPVRSGIGGMIDRLSGPGATRTEYVLQYAIPFLVAIGAFQYANGTQPDWAGWKVLIFSFLAFDMVGGIITNSTSTAKRWFHRAGQGKRDHLKFVLAHVIHIAFVAALFREMDLVYFAALSGYLLGSASLILSVPLYLQRPVALIFVSAGIALDIYVWGQTTSVEWFVPLLLLKLLVAHLLYEEPYRPLKGKRHAS